MPGRPQERVTPDAARNAEDRHSARCASADSVGVWPFVCVCGVACVPAAAGVGPPRSPLASDLIFEVPRLSRSHRYPSGPHVNPTPVQASGTRVPPTEREPHLNLTRRDHDGSPPRDTSQINEADCWAV